MLGTGKDAKAAQATKNDYELFLQAFQKPTQIYKLLGYRHCVNPLFLHRTTSYLKHRRTCAKRTPKTIETMAKELSKKATTEERSKSREGSYKISITDIDNKSNPVKNTETYDVQLYLRKITQKDKSERSGRGRLSLQHKLHIVELFEKNPNLPTSAVAKEYGHSFSTVRLIKIQSKEIKQAAENQKITGDTIKIEPKTPEEEEPPIANLKFTANDRKSAARSPSKMPSVTTIRCSTLAKHSSGQGCILEFRVRLRAAKSTAKDNMPSKKKRCIEEWCSAQVVVQNETGTTVLGDGSYTLFLRPTFSDSWKPSQVSWESVSSKEEETYIKSDTLEDDDSNSCSTISFDVKTDNCDVSVLCPKKSLSPKKTKKPGDGLSLKSDETKGVLMYNFLYNGNTLQQTECRKNRICPWCSLNCSKLYSLLEHISRCHPRFKVTFIPGLNGFDELDVEVNELVSMTPVPCPDENCTVPIFSGPNRREHFQLQMLGTLTRRKRSKADFMVIDIAPYKAPHSRLYFHSKSYEPILPHEFEYDSEQEESMSWMEERTKQMIQDFTDVNEAEKAIMIMWNCFILPKRPLADHQVPGLAREFVEQKGGDILKQGLVKNLILHLTNLHSFGLLKPEELESIMVGLYNRNSKGKQLETTAQKQEKTAQKQETVAQNQEKTAQKQETIAQNQEKTAQKQETIAQNQEKTAQKQETIAQNQEKPARTQETAAHNLEKTTQNPEKNVISDSAPQSNTQPDIQASTAE